MSDKHEVEELWEEFLDVVIPPKVDMNKHAAKCASTAILLHRTNQTVRNGREPAEWVMEQIRMNMAILRGDQ